RPPIALLILVFPTLSQGLKREPCFKLSLFYWRPPAELRRSQDINGLDLPTGVTRVVQPKGLPRRVTNRVRLSRTPSSPRKNAAPKRRGEESVDGTPGQRRGSFITRQHL